MTTRARNLLFLLPIFFFGFLHAEGTKVKTYLLDPVDAKRERKVPVKVYLVPSGKPQPVIVFSHGLGGSRNNNPYLGNHWAENGYVAVFVQHIGSDESVWKDAERGERFSALKEAAGLQALLDRLADVPFVLDELEAWNASPDHPLSGQLDLEHIGMTGHSFGAVTTMGLTGRKFPLNQEFKDDRIDAFLPMSPQPGAGSAENAFGHLKVPILCMTGTEDKSPIDPTLTPEDRQRVYQVLPPGDKYHLVLYGAEHMAFGEGREIAARRQNPNHHPAILKISTKYWDAYLKEDEAAKKWLQSQSPREACNLDARDVWEWK